MILIDDGFYSEFYGSRMVAIEGKLGDGKTLLGLDIAEPLLKDGYKFISNMSCIWNDNMEVLQKSDKVVCAVDEGGTYLRSAEAVNKFSRFLRKIDYFLIMPCRKLPHEELCELTISPWFNFHKNFGLPFKLWRYDVRLGKKAYNGKILQVNWQAYYGLYSSIDPGDYPELIMQAIEVRTDALFKQFERKLKLRDVALKSNLARDFEQVELARDFSRSAQALGDALSVVEGVTNSRGGVKKRNR